MHSGWRRDRARRQQANIAPILEKVLMMTTCAVTKLVRYGTVRVTRGDTPTQSTRHLPFFQTTHVYDEKFPILLAREPRNPKRAGATRAGTQAGKQAKMQCNKGRLGAKRGLFCARRCSGMCGTYTIPYTHDQHTCPTQKLRVIPQSSEV